MKQWNKFLVLNLVYTKKTLKFLLNQNYLQQMKLITIFVTDLFFIQCPKSATLLIFICFEPPNHSFIHFNKLSHQHIANTSSQHRIVSLLAVFLALLELMFNFSFLVYTILSHTWILKRSSTTRNRFLICFIISESVFICLHILVTNCGCINDVIVRKESNNKTYAVILMCKVPKQICSVGNVWHCILNKITRC